MNNLIIAIGDRLVTKCGHKATVVNIIKGIKGFNIDRYKMMDLFEIRFDHRSTDLYGRERLIELFKPVKEVADLLINDETFAWLTVTPKMARTLVEHTDIEVYTLDQPYEHPVYDEELEECIESGAVPLAITIGYLDDVDEEEYPIRITDDFFVWRTFTPEEASLIWKHKIFTLCVLYDDESEALIESAEDFMGALANGATFGTVAGFLHEAGSI